MATQQERKCVVCQTLLAKNAHANRKYCDAHSFYKLYAAPDRARPPVSRQRTKQRRGAIWACTNEVVDDASFYRTRY